MNAANLRELAEQMRIKGEPFANDLLEMIDVAEVDGPALQRLQDIIDPMRDLDSAADVEAHAKEIFEALHSHVWEDTPPDRWIVQMGAAEEIMREVMERVGLGPLLSEYGLIPTLRAFLS